MASPELTKCMICGKDTSPDQFIVSSNGITPYDTCKTCPLHCYRCDKYKLYTEFSIRDDRNPRTNNTPCKECERIRAKIYRKNKKEVQGPKKSSREKKKEVQDAKDNSLRVCEYCKTPKKASQFTHDLTKSDCLSENCKECQEKIHGKNLEDYANILIKRCERRTEKHGFPPMTITVKYIVVKYVLQQSKCALTDWPMTLGIEIPPGAFNTNMSIDRIDSTKGYTVENVHLVCASVNKVKNDLPMEVFRVMIQAISIKLKISPSKSVSSLSIPCDKETKFCIPQDETKNDAQEEIKTCVAQEESCSSDDPSEEYKGQCSQEEPA